MALCMPPGELTQHGCAGSSQYSAACMRRSAAHGSMLGRPPAPGTLHRREPASDRAKRAPAVVACVRVPVPASPLVDRSCGLPRCRAPGAEGPGAPSSPRQPTHTAPPPLPPQSVRSVQDIYRSSPNLRGPAPSGTDHARAAADSRTTGSAWAELRCIECGAGLGREGAARRRPSGTAHGQSSSRSATADFATATVQSHSTQHVSLSPERERERESRSAYLLG